MVSPELIRRYPFFARLEPKQLSLLGQSAEDLTVEPGHVFFREEEEVDKFYLVVDGTVAIVMEVPDRSSEQPLSGQLTGEIRTEDVVVSTVGSGEVFGWSALVPPPEASAGAKAVTECRVIAFDANEIRGQFEDDCRFAYLLTQKAATVMRERLRDMRIESLTLHQKQDE